jgi:hypothetical protein
LKLVKVFLRKGRWKKENDGEDEVAIYGNVTAKPLYNYYILTKTLRNLKIKRTRSWFEW